MGMDKTVSEALNKWAAEERAKLPDNIKTLITLAKWDLYYGPIGDQDANNLHDGEPVEWKGYSDACDKIRAALGELHLDDVWVDIQCGGVMTEEPKGYYEDNPDHDPEDEESNSEVWVEPNWEDIYKVDAKRVKAVIVGDTELITNL